MQIEGQVFASLSAANAAVTVAEAGWTPPALKHTSGVGRYALDASLAPQRLASPIALVALTYFVPRVGTAFTGTFIDTSEIVGNALVAPLALGAESGVALRPGADSSTEEVA